MEGQVVVVGDDVFSSEGAKKRPGGATDADMSQKNSKK